MLNLATDNTLAGKLIEDIVQDHSKLGGLSTQILEQVINFSVTKDDYRVLDIITNIHTGIYGYDERKPEWLESDFIADKWVLTLSKKPKTIHWDSVYIDDGKKLTDKKHRKLLSSFKYWITAVDNPFENGGKIIAPVTAYNKVNRVITLINAILLYAKELKLARHHLRHVNDDFWLNTLTKFANRGDSLGIYEPEKRLKVLLNNASKDVTQADAQSFTKEYPYITRDIAQDEVLLSLDNRNKACAWLFKQGFYSKAEAIRHEGSSTVASGLLFEGRMLYHGIALPSYTELYLKEPKRDTEYLAVENTRTSKGTNQSTISAYIDAIRLIHTNLERKDAASPCFISERVSTASIGQLVDLKKQGRTRTLPPDFVFNIICQCYEFAKEHLPTKEGAVSLLDETLTQLSKARSKSASKKSNTLRPSQGSLAWNDELHRNMSGTERGYWFQTEAINCLSKDYLKKGVKQIQGFAVGTEDRHDRIRANESLFDLFSVLQGSIQVLVGAIMARRQDELVKLKSHGNLSPDTDPFSEEGEKTEYSLVFKVKKTGILHESLKKSFYCYGKYFIND